ncbi:MAG TPA: PAS domain-containing sensor histidine kinase [Gaiellaceae bacterium]
MSNPTSTVESATALEDDRARLAAVVQSMPAGLVIVDADGRVQMANEEALRILGGDGAIPGEREGYAAGGRRYAHDELPLARTLRTGAAIANERIQLVTPEGKTVVIDVFTSPVQASNGRTIGALALFQDVTAQERRQRAERDFVTNAAHELQSPLAAIVSAIEVLQAGAKDSDQRDVFLGHIERESDRLARLVRALLILARAQTDVEAPRDEVVAVEAILSETASRLPVGPRVQVEVECPPDLALVTNRELLEQTVTNLAENAAKHTDEGRIVLAAAEEDGTVEITVSDTGSGIAAAEQARVFDRFYRGPVGTEAGFGLGLAIVAAATDALAGDVALESSVGRGTVVRLRLPRAASLTGR